MKSIEVSWIRKGKQLTIGSDIEELLGWTSEQAEMMPVESLLTPSTFLWFKEYYYKGPPNCIKPRAFPARLIHRDGYEVCVRIAVVCRYDRAGDLNEAWGSVYHQQRQDDQNYLLAWWPTAKEEHLDALLDTANMYECL